MIVTTATKSAELYTWLATRGDDNDESIAWGKRDLPDDAAVVTALYHVTREVGDVEVRVTEGALAIKTVPEQLPWLPTYLRIREAAARTIPMDGWQFHYSFLRGGWAEWRPGL